MPLGKKGNIPSFVHTPEELFEQSTFSGGFLRDGRIFLDFLSVVLRIRAVQLPAARCHGLLAFTWNTRGCVRHNRCRSLLFHIHFFSTAVLPWVTVLLLPLPASRLRCLLLFTPTILPYFSYESCNGLMDRRIRVPVLLPISGANCIISLLANAVATR